jgi:hypothetical protein
MPDSIAETYAAKPDYYGTTFCVAVAARTFRVGADGEFRVEGPDGRNGPKGRDVMPDPLVVTSRDSLQSRSRSTRGRVRGILAGLPKVAYFWTRDFLGRSFGQHRIRWLRSKQHEVRCAAPKARASECRRSTRARWAPCSRTRCANQVETPRTECEAAADVRGCGRAPWTTCARGRDRTTRSSPCTSSAPTSGASGKMFRAGEERAQAPSAMAKQRTQARSLPAAAEQARRRHATAVRKLQRARRGPRAARKKDCAPPRRERLRLRWNPDARRDHAPHAQAVRELGPARRSA